MAKNAKQRVPHQRRRLGAIERDILDDLTAGDMLYGFFLSGRSSYRMMRLARERANNRYRSKLALERLVAQNLVKKQGQKLVITQKGRYALGSAAAETRKMLTTVPWDGKWRIVAFDIPEEFAGQRDMVRRILKQAGFELLQRSIWIFPHECEELAAILKEHSHLSKHILYGVLEKVENEARLKKLFRL